MLIKQSFTLFINLSTELKKLIDIMVQNKIYGTSFADNETFNFYLRKKTRSFIEEDKPLAKLLQLRKNQMLLR